MQTSLYSFVDISIKIVLETKPAVHVCRFALILLTCMCVSSSAGTGKCRKDIFCFHRTLASVLVHDISAKQNRFQGIWITFPWTVSKIIIQKYKIIIQQNNYTESYSNRPNFISSSRLTTQDWNSALLEAFPVFRKIVARFIHMC